MWYYLQKAVVRNRTTGKAARNNEVLNRNSIERSSRGLRRNGQTIEKVVRWRVGKYWGSKDRQWKDRKQWNKEQRDRVAMGRTWYLHLFLSRFLLLWFWRQKLKSLYVLLMWAEILRNGMRNQWLNSLFPGNRIALQALPLQQDRIARTTTTDLTMSLGFTSRVHPYLYYSAFLFQTVMTLLKQNSSSSAVLHFVLELVLHCTNWLPFGWNQKI